VLSAELNEGNTYIYDGGLDVVVWHGRDTTSQEKAKVGAILQKSLVASLQSA